MARPMPRERGTREGCLRPSSPPWVLLLVVCQGTERTSVRVLSGKGRARALTIESGSR
jgi:hypothetical protein